MSKQLKKLENEFYKEFKMVLGVGESKAKSLSIVAINVLIRESNKLKNDK